jgi:ribosome biogenesis protein ERB1
LSLTKFTDIKKYNLAELKLEQKLTTGVKWISSFDIHPGGDNLIMGSYDKRVSWFDMDLSTKPYKVLRYGQSDLR